MSKSENNLGPHVGVILAGGQSSRMGVKDKALIAVGGKPMLQRVIERLRPQVERMVLSTNGDAARYASFGLPVVVDPIEGPLGPLAGLLAGMRWSEKNLPEARFIASAAADTPFFPADVVERLSEGCGRDENTVALAASSAGTHPIFGLWPVALADGLERFLRSGEPPKMLAFADRFMRLNVPFDDIALPGGGTVDPFFNVNTPEDVRQAEEIAEALKGLAGTAPAAVA